VTTYWYGGGMGKCLSCSRFTFGCHQSEVLDVEEIVVHGRMRQACGYYGARRAVPGAHIVVLPYQLLFHQPTRQALRLPLDGNTVIVDEAHNLLDTLAEMHSASLSATVLSQAVACLRLYLVRCFGHVHVGRSWRVSRLGMMHACQRRTRCICTSCRYLPRPG
jgi:hypothetical protein